jgi:putative transposase
MTFPDDSMPKGWSLRVRSALLHAASLAHQAVTYSRSWAVDSPLVRVRLASRLERAHQEIALLSEEIRIKDMRWAKIDARRRPHYSPTERLAILALRTARAWSAAQTARAFLVEGETIASWTRRIDEQGAKALVRLPVPVNKFPDFVARIVTQMRTLCPAMGKKRIAQHLAAAGLAIGATSVQRMLKRPSHTPRGEPSAPTPPLNRVPREALSPERTVTALRPNHVWHLDLTAVPTLRGFWMPWSPFALPQVWPFCWWLAVVIDHFSRAVIGFSAYRKPPSSEQLCVFLEETIRGSAGPPKYLISDKGTQFWSERFRSWCSGRGIRQRFGAVGRYGSIAIIERFFRSLKSECIRRILVPLEKDHFRQEISLYCDWYNRHRPHQGLAGNLPLDVYAPEPRPHKRAIRRGRGRSLPRLALSVSFLENRQHLPVVKLRKAA